MPTPHQVTQTLVARLLATDGTFSVDTAEPRDYHGGYQVGVFGIRVRRENPEASAILALFVQEVARKGYCDIGSWADTEGVVHVDACVYFGSRDRAVQAARTWGQVAIWDWSARESFETPVAGVPAPYLQVDNHGSVCLITPVGREAVDWLEQTAPEDAQWWGRRSLVVEPRYVAGVLAAWEAR